MPISKIKCQNNVNYSSIIYIETYTLYHGDFALVEYKSGDLFPEGKYIVEEQVIDKAGNYDWISFKITVNSG